MAIATSKENLNSTEISNLVASGVLRERLTANRTYYVDPAGSDSNDGLTVGTPFLTPIKACTVIMNELDLAGFQVTVQFADGTYDDINPAFSFVGMVRLYGVISQELSYAGAITFRGNPGTPANVVFRINDGNFGFDFAGVNSSIVVDGFTITKLPAATSLSGGIASYDPSGFVYAQNIRFDDTPGIICFVAANRGYLAISGDISLVAGSRVNLVEANSGGFFEQFTGTDIEFLAGVHTYTDDVICSIRGSYVQLGGSFTETGTVTGRSFQVSGGATLRNLATSGDIPGDSPPLVTDDSAITVNASTGDQTGLQYNGKIREKLTAFRSYFVDDALGDDNNDGLSSGAGAFKTISKAVSVVLDDLDLNGFNVNISVADGTYAETINLRGHLLSKAANSSLSINGNLGTPGNVVVSAILATGCDANSIFSVGGMRIDAVTLEDCALLNLFNVEFTGSAATLMTLDRSRLKISGTFDILGSYTDLALIRDGSSLDVNGSATIDFTVAVTPTTQFTVTGDSFADLSDITFANPGNVTTGQRFLLDQKSHIQTDTDDLTYIPGSTAGVLSNGSTYDNTTLQNGVNVETLAANRTLVDGSDLRVQILDPGGANRDVDLPASGALVQREYLVINPAGSGFDLLLKESASTLSTITPGTQAAVVYDGTDWITI